MRRDAQRVILWISRCPRIGICFQGGYRSRQNCTLPSLPGAPDFGQYRHPLPRIPRNKQYIFLAARTHCSWICFAQSGHARTVSAVCSRGTAVCFACGGQYLLLIAGTVALATCSISRYYLDSRIAGSQEQLSGRLQPRAAVAGRTWLNKLGGA